MSLTQRLMVCMWRYAMFGSVLLGFYFLGVPLLTRGIAGLGLMPLFASPGVLIGLLCWANHRQSKATTLNE